MRWAAEQTLQTDGRCAAAAERWCWTDREGMG